MMQNKSLIEYREEFYGFCQRMRFKLRVDPSYVLTIKAIDD
jgi:hypothetical protein